jgi:hypothetical protein
VVIIKEKFGNDEIILLSALMVPYKTLQSKHQPKRKQNCNH